MTRPRDERFAATGHFGRSFAFEELGELGKDRQGKLECLLVADRAQSG
jgi:hypothetical protein